MRKGVRVSGVTKELGLFWESLGTQGDGDDGWQNRPPYHVSLWNEAYFELQAFGKRANAVGLSLNSPYLLEDGSHKWNSVVLNLHPGSFIHQGRLTLITEGSRS